ncbi:hypothetical protein ACFYOY_36200 [Streptomyces sp. NPDC007875]|uniref:hypothetical protein n=1 Tax=Streptomyces sp. NPDC007875 TaxID=3364783 RepID=UPI0036965DA0
MRTPLEHMRISTAHIPAHITVTNTLAGRPPTKWELSVWIKAVRGEGKWEHTGRTHRSIARYWHVLDPILRGWIADGIESLREITQDDVKRAIATRKGTPARTRKGTPARSIHIVLRNVFRALRQESVIFRDPTRGLVLAGINKTPPSVPSDRLAGVLSHAQNDFQRFVMVLVCVHALSGTDMRHLLLTDLDLSRERLIVRRPGKRHIIYLDELTYRCASAWIRERHRRWPVTTNPHLLVDVGLRWTPPTRPSAPRSPTSSGPPASNGHAIRHCGAPRTHSEAATVRGGSPEANPHHLVMGHQASRMRFGPVCSICIRSIRPSGRATQPGCG